MITLIAIAITRAYFYSIAICARTDVAIETTEIIMVKSNTIDVVTIICPVNAKMLNLKKETSV